MKLTTLALGCAVVLGMAVSAQAQPGTPPGSPLMPNTQMQNGSTGSQPGATSGQGTQQANPKNDQAPGNPQVHDGTGNAGNTPPNAGGTDGGGRVNSHTQQ